MRVVASAVLALTACAPAGEPPGRSASSSEPAAPGPATASATPTAPASASATPTAPASAGMDGGDDSGTRGLEPGHGEKLAALAMRTWVHADPALGATRLGYLRAGAVVERAAEPAGTEGCPGGWYRVLPRGFVCIGKTASLDLDNDVVAAAVRGPRRGEPFPYHYVISRRPPPPRYVRLPSGKEQRRVEGTGPEVGQSSWALRNRAVLGDADALTPFFASGRDTPKPFGAEERLRFDVHRGRAKGLSAFGLSATFDWTGRRFGVTTELDLIPIDRTNVVRASAMRGVEIKAAGTPAFVIGQGVVELVPKNDGGLEPGGAVAHRSGWVLTGRHSGARGELSETAGGAWLPTAALRVATLRKDMWGWADRGRRWIDVAIGTQILVAYEGLRPVYATLVSTGRGGLGDPETTSATIQGTFFIREKHVTATMDGDEASDDAFDLHDVPYVQYFHKSYALHGAYWHDAFGKVRSHGCVNLAPADAAWLFEWTDPVVPTEWHGVVGVREGTLVYIHE